MMLVSLFLHSPCALNDLLDCFSWAFHPLCYVIFGILSSSKEGNYTILAMYVLVDSEYVVGNDVFNMKN